MKHPLKTVAVSAVLSIALLSSAAYAALNTNAGFTPDAKPAYAGEQLAAAVKTDRDGAPGHNEDDDKGRKGGSHNDSDNDGRGDSDGDDGEGHGSDDGNDGDSDGNDGDGEGSDGEGNDGDSD